MMLPLSETGTPALPSAPVTAPAPQPEYPGGTPFGGIPRREVLASDPAFASAGQSEPSSLCMEQALSLPPASSPFIEALSKESINELPVGVYEGEILLVRNERELETALNELWDESVIGFDTETKPTFIKGSQEPPALVQLAGHSRVYLVQLTRIPYGEALAALLSTPHILKVGVGIHEDMRGLDRVYPFQAGGVVDLSLMAHERGFQARSLRALTAQILGFRISKAVQCSNWARFELGERQIIYAATDAWVGRQLYLALQELPIRVKV